MLRKLAKRITNNFGLKVLAVVFAIIIWLLVVNTEDPEKTKGFSVPVTIENADYLTQMGKTYEVLNNTDWVSIRVTGRRSVFQELSVSDFRATANLENISEDMTKIPISVTAARYADQIEISKQDAFMEVSVENLATERFEVQVVTTGSPAAGCYIDATKITPGKVNVSGPESVVQQIQSAQVTVNVEGAKEDIATNADIVLLDASGSAVPLEHLSLNRVTAAIDISVLMEKEVPLVFETTGTPAEGYRNTGVSSTVEKVRLKGSASALEALGELKITSPQLNINGATKETKAVIDLKDYLPDGVFLADGEPSSAEVTIAVEGQSTRSFLMPAGNITVEGLPDGLELKFDNTTVTVNITGYAEELDGISAADLKGTLDASSFAVGSYAAAVVIQGDYTAQASAPVTVSEKGPGIVDALSGNTSGEQALQSGEGAAGDTP